MTAKRAPNAFLPGNRVSVRDIPNRKSMAVRQRRRDEFARGESRETRAANCRGRDPRWKVYRGLAVGRHATGNALMHARIRSKRTPLNDQSRYTRRATVVARDWPSLSKIVSQICKIWPRLKIEIALLDWGRKTYVDGGQIYFVVNWTLFVIPRCSKNKNVPETMRYRQ